MEQRPDVSKIKEIKTKLSRAYYQEEQFWKLKSRVKWLREGDRNTKFFHGCVKTRKSKNRMVSLVDNDGLQRTGEEDISKVAINYFESLFQSNANSD